MVTFWEDKFFLQYGFPEGSLSLSESDQACSQGGTLGAEATSLSNKSPQSKPHERSWHHFAMHKLPSKMSTILQVEKGTLFC